MQVGLSTRMATPWFDEFSSSCEALGLDWRPITTGADDWMDQVKGLDLFIWRLTMSDPSSMAEARTKIPILTSMGIQCFPNQQMLWLYDDKIRETYFLRQHGYPTPRTWVFFEAGAAREFGAGAAFPLVAKSHCGAGSGGVERLDTRAQALKLLDRTFRKHSIWFDLIENYYYLPRLAKGDLLAQLRFRYRDAWPRFAYFQEFLHIERDWRITTLGADLVSVFSRKNRPDDFRASGSGIWEKTEEKDLPTEACELALEISNTHGFTCMTFDFMRRGEAWVIGEISYAFMLNAVYSDTLFTRGPDGYRRAEPVPIGEMHLRAMLAKGNAVGDAVHA